MRPILAAMAAAIALVLASPVFAASAEMQATFGNTVTNTAEDGSQVAYLFNDDGTVTRVNADGTKTEGDWAENNGTLCNNFGDKECWQLAPGKKVGDTWKAASPDGKTATIAIVAGR